MHLAASSLFGEKTHLTCGYKSMVLLNLFIMQNIVIILWRVSNIILFITKKLFLREFIVAFLQRKIESYFDFID